MSLSSSSKQPGLAGIGSKQAGLSPVPYTSLSLFEADGKEIFSNCTSCWQTKAKTKEKLRHK